MVSLNFVCPAEHGQQLTDTVTYSTCVYLAFLFIFYFLNVHFYNWIHCMYNHVKYFLIKLFVQESSLLTTLHSKFRKGQIFIKKKNYIFNLFQSEKIMIKVWVKPERQKRK